MSCCPEKQKKKKDWMFIICGLIIALSYLQFLLFPTLQIHFSHSVFELMNTMAPGMAIGIIFVGLLSFVPREVVISTVGSPKTKSGILKATAAGLLLDLCSHGILMVGMKLYERGASLAQVMAFLIASPWNSFSLTIILMSLIGVKFTLLFIFLSALVAVITGLIIRALLLKSFLPANPNQVVLPENYKVMAHLKESFSGKFSSSDFYKEVFLNGLRDGKMVMRWLFFGVVLTAGVRIFATPEIFQEYVGPTVAGMGITLFVATVLEVCSEGSAPLGADLVNRAGAPGNGFAFIMTGVSTDYTEIMSIKDTTKNWMSALILPILTLPQVVALGFLLNNF